jgi:hypothetical protein
MSVQPKSPPELALETEAAHAEAVRTVSTGEVLLERLREVGQRIEERVLRVSDPGARRRAVNSRAGDG